MVLNRTFYIAIYVLLVLYGLFGKVACTEVSRLLSNSEGYDPQEIAINDESNGVSTNPLTDPCASYSCAIDPPNQCTIVGCSCGRFDRICRSRSNF